MKDWRCKTCGVTYTPEPPDYKSKPLTAEPVKEQGPPERLCPECGEAMRCGYLVETNTPLTLMTLGERIYWSIGEGGMLGDRVALKAYACPGCGHISLYARRLDKDRAIIEKAPYACQ
jgi:rubredoxin